MCQQIVTFCSGSAKPLLFAGSFIMLLLAVSVAYMGCATHSLYSDVDARIADNHLLLFYGQIVSAIYLVLLTIFATVAAHFDHKHSIRALTVLTSLNFMLAAAAILLVPSTELATTSAITNRLEQAQMYYDRTEKPSIDPRNSSSLKLTVIDKEQPRLLPNLDTPGKSARVVRMSEVEGSSPSKLSLALEEPPTKPEATRIWDKVQGRGCCGLKNSTEWRIDGRTVLPKSCCSNPIESGPMFVCESVDVDHNRPCIDIVQSTSLNLSIVLASIALVSLFLATVSGVCTYRTFHYSEASQNAYT